MDDENNKKDSELTIENDGGAGYDPYNQRNVLPKVKRPRRK
jgi:hypothetical protein